MHDADLGSPSPLYQGDAMVGELGNMACSAFLNAVASKEDRILRFSGQPKLVATGRLPSRAEWRKDQPRRGWWPFSRG